MTAITNQNKANNPTDALNENQDLIAVDPGKARCSQTVKAALSNNELRNQLEEQFYNKARGCSVKAQVDSRSIINPG